MSGSLLTTSGRAVANSAWPSASWSTDLNRLSAEGLGEWDGEQGSTFALWAIVAHENRLKRIEEVLRKEGLL